MTRTMSLSMGIPATSAPTSIQNPPGQLAIAKARLKPFSENIIGTKPSY
jgi:hypothetical protein